MDILKRYIKIKVPPPLAAAATDKKNTQKNKKHYSFVVFLHTLIYLCHDDVVGTNDPG